MSKPNLYFQQDSVAAALVKVCPVLHKEYAPPLVSMGGGMHMVLSVGTAKIAAAKLTHTAVVQGV